MVTASFRFYDVLGDFLPRERRGCAFSTPCAREATAKHMIEALGVPHTEVELLLVNGVSSGFEYLLREGDRVAVYPAFGMFDVRPLQRLRPLPEGRPRFVADAHLGALARLLRMAGYDTLYDNHYHDDEIERIARATARCSSAAASNAAATCMRWRRKPSCANCSRACAWAPGCVPLRCACTATCPCARSPRRWCLTACRRGWRSCTRNSPPAMPAAGCTGRARTMRAWRPSCRAWRRRRLM
jgi:hypothetical protein